MHENKTSNHLHRIPGPAVSKREKKKDHFRLRRINQNLKSKGEAQRVKDEVVGRKCPKMQKHISKGQSSAGMLLQLEDRW